MAGHRDYLGSCHDIMGGGASKPPQISDHEQVKENLGVIMEMRQGLAFMHGIRGRRARVSAPHEGETFYRVSIMNRARFGKGEES
jgi:hypothetical protein